MSYCSGGDLENYTAKRGAQPWSVVKPFALQVLSALKAAHDKGLLHRDLKPSNIMLADENEPISLQLIDFGLVKVLDSQNPSETATMATTDGAFMGNPLTASPEQFREEDLDERSDLFSLGITLWYLLHGGSPFGNVAAAKIAHQRLSVANYDDLLPKKLDPEARKILSKLLTTDREKRFRYAQDVIDAIKGGSKKSGTPPPISIKSEEQVPFEKAWKIGSQIRQFSYGHYYACQSLMDPSAAPAALFIPDQPSPFSSSVIEHCRDLVKASTNHLCAFQQEGIFDGATAFICQQLSTCSLQTLLQKVGRLNIHSDLSLFKTSGVSCR
ncbi:MAG: serine/threonine protein kinase [Akkermansiaceae bacterium]|nr:serine/threonine protein kinase [Akkermansiaceae bacterium]